LFLNNLGIVIVGLVVSGILAYDKL
jgi:hypothetical protein